MNNKKALIVGINNYPNSANKLNCCVNDANEIAKLLERNYDESKNFDVAELLDADATECNIKGCLNKVFDDDTDVGLFYFSGHGNSDNKVGRLVTYDYSAVNGGLDFNELNKILVHSKCKNKIVILDCCFSGLAGNETSFLIDTSILSRGTTILAACRERELASEIGDHGVFTNLLVLALSGGSSDLFGRVTPASVYSYIDSCLSAFEQRPLFKSYVSSFITLRQCKPKMTTTEIRNLCSLFASSTAKVQLDPSFEPTNYEGSREIAPKDLKKPYHKDENVKLFALLQKGNRNGLIVPTNEKHMYYAAMNSDSCELTKLGVHYWLLASKKII